MHTVIDLDGVNVARAKVLPGPAASLPTVLLEITSPSGFIDGQFYPAESFSLDSIESVRALHALLSTMIQEHDAMRRPAPPFQGTKL